MCLLKEHPTPGQRVNVWGLGLRVPAEAADPVIQVINGKEQDIWAALLLIPSPRTGARPRGKLSDKQEYQQAPDHCASALKLKPVSADPPLTVISFTFSPNSSCQAAMVYCPSGNSGIRKAPLASVTAKKG